MTKKTIVYTETGSGYRYANYATIDDVQFPQVERRRFEEVRDCVFYRERERVKRKRKLLVHDEHSQLFWIWMKKHSIRNLRVWKSADLKRFGWIDF